MKYPLLIAASLIGLAVPAQAQDLSGFRVEARGGWNQSSTELAFPNPDYDEDEEDSEEFLIASDSRSSVALGGEIGYDVQLGYNGSGLVIGAYAGVDFTQGEICAELVEDDLACAGLDRTITAGVRAGVPLGQASLLYVKGGYSNGQFDVSYDNDVTDNDDTTPGEILEFSDTLDGWHVGGGVELGLTRRLYAKLEYTYTQFSTQSYAADDAEAGDPALDAGTSRHLVMAGVGLRF